MNPNEDINPHADEIASLEAQIGAIDITALDPMDNGKIKQDIVGQPVQENVAEVTTKPTETTTEDPIKTELERVKGQTQGKTPQEKFEYKLRRELAQAKEMGIDIAGLAGIKTAPEAQEEEAEKPLTRKDLEQILRSTKPQTKTATEMALEIENEAERELHLHYLENKVNPNLSEEEKFQTAKEMVDGIKLKNQMVLNNVKPAASGHSTAGSFQPAKTASVDNVKLSPMEEMFLRDAQIRGVALTKEEIIAMRSK